MAIAAGVAVWIVAEARRTPAPPAPAEVAPPRPEPAPEPPRAVVPQTRTLRRRMAASLAFVTLFFAGAALAAGAGNEVAAIDGGATNVAATDATDAATTTTDAATTTGDAVTTTDATDAAPVPAAATEPTETTDATDTTADAGTTSTTDPGTTTDETADDAAMPTVPVVTTSAATTTTDATLQQAPASAPVAAAPHRVQRKHPRIRATVRPQHRVARAVAAAAAPAPSPFPVLPFDPQQWLVDHPGTPLGNAAVALAEHYLGVPYRWGGNEPSTGFDCSGLTQYVYGQLGVWLPHYAAAQFLAYPRVDPSQLQPGDLVFFEPKADGPGHVAIYAGDDRIVEAPHTGAVVRIGSLSGAAASMGFLGAVRPTASATQQQLFSVTPTRTASPPATAAASLAAGRALAE